MAILKEKKILFFIIILFLFTMTGCSKTSSDIGDYLNTGNELDDEAKEMMPNLKHLPEYEDIEYRYTHHTMLMFQSDSVVLVVKYDDETYESEKGKLAENYTFLNINSPTNETVTPEYEFIINSYIFKVVNGSGFPKSFGMIGTSDEKQSIAYLYFYDFDLDSIGDEGDRNPMPDFVKQYFDYDF